MIFLSESSEHQTQTMVTFEVNSPGFVPPKQDLASGDWGVQARREGGGVAFLQQGLSLL